MNPTDEVDDLLKEAGANWRAGQPSAPEPELDRIIGPRRPRRWLVPALAAASVAAIATAAIIVLPDKHEPSVAQGNKTTAGDRAMQGPASVAQGKQHPLQVREGDRVQVDGKVVAAPGKPVLYCLPVVSTLPATVGGPVKPPACDSPTAVVVLTGVDVDKLPELTTTQGVKTGLAHLEGIWADGKIAVDKQGPVAYPPAPSQKVPCAPPAGGWKPGDSNDLITPAVAAFADARPDQLQELSIGWPNGVPANGAPDGPSVVMVGVAHGDLAQIRQLLTPLVKGNLCVTQVKLSKSEIEKLRNQVAAIPVSVLRPLSTGGGVGDHPINVDLQILDDQAVAALTPIGLDNLNIEPVIRPAP